MVASMVVSGSYDGCCWDGGVGRGSGKSGSEV